ncbi:MAG: hypothetical protein JWR26_4958 [Pedosphaera sp.]|nr:hypothetical protein [Pedosphaera sp.]
MVGVLACPPFLLRFQKATTDRLLAASPACGTWRLAKGFKAGFAKRGRAHSAAAHRRSEVPRAGRALCRGRRSFCKVGAHGPPRGPKMGRQHATSRNLSRPLGGVIYFFVFREGKGCLRTAIMKRGRFNHRGTGVREVLSHRARAGAFMRVKAGSWKNICAAGDLTCCGQDARGPFGGCADIFMQWLVNTGAELEHFHERCSDAGAVFLALGQKPSHKYPRRRGSKERNRKQNAKGNENWLGTADLWAGCFVARRSQPHGGGCSLLTPRIQPKSLAAPSAAICERASLFRLGHRPLRACS